MGPYLATKYPMTEADRMELAQWEAVANNLPHTTKPIEYGPIGFSSESFFKPKGCYDGENSGEHEIELYCSGNVLIMTLSLINAIIFILLLVVHIKVNRRSHTCI